MNGKSEVAYPVNAVSSVPDCASGVEVVGKSLTAVTVIASESVSVADPSFVTIVITAFVLSLEALVQVIVAIAVLMLATVPLIVTVDAAVP